MKKALLFFFLILIVIKAWSQTEYDCISRDELFILKTGSDIKSTSKIKAADLKNSKIAEQQFGANFKTKKYTQETNDKSYTNLVYDNGLKLYMADDQKTPVNFEITTDKYLMLIGNERVIKVGMKADELKAIFPKSYSKRKVITNIYGKEGKISIPVCLSFTYKNKVYIEDSLIEFTLGGEGGILEIIESVEPR